ncbi:cytochrome-c peroxidase [Desulfuromonas sp. AOP6]|uniref:cytochrome-c peroxidase n=1 Tax=Desulfuromonas sp. AOP6 TaxID=1566351 RepID=UPI001274E437|nr:cytochrome-c peroxidase [Desulfuromonas sp. AOP6]BCA78771.1 cytochrome c biogenesis protein CcsA [Desulfuromonas sp. AOP6]
MTRLIALLAAALFLPVGPAYAASDSLLSLSQTIFKPLPTEPPAIEGNPATPAKLELGKMLFFDPRLSASQLISCNTCHNVGLAGGDLQETSVGHNWQKGPRNAPTVMNAVFNSAQFWDGRAKDLAEQAKGPVQASVEMNNTPERVLETLNSMPEYVDRFAKAFPGEKSPLTFDNVARAIEVFEALLLTPAPFDSYLRGDAAALTDQEKAGLDLFINKGCAGCHDGVNVGGSGYFPFGVVEKPGSEVMSADDKGRFQVTNTASDAYVFRAPSLRNVALTAPYFHSGKVWSLQEATSIMGSSQLGISLTPGDEKLLVTFMETLNGIQPEIVYPLLPVSTGKTPRPILQ